MSTRSRPFVAWLLVALSVHSPVGAQQNVTVGFEATTSFWWTIHEEVENGLRQQGSGDVADDHASGFSFRHGRLGFLVQPPSKDLELRLRIRLEERTDIVDFYGGWLPNELLNLYVGQMKIPSTAEVQRPYDELDFASRSTFGLHVGDYALTRTPYISSLMAAKAHNRDLGLALKGAWEGDHGRRISWFVMASNGLGANRYIGGDQNEEFLFTNSIGELYYGARIEASPHELITGGVHASYNAHTDVALGDRGPVFDIRRTVWTVDLEAGKRDGWRLYAFYGSGDMEDFFDSQRYLFDYSGLSAQTVYPLLAGKLELALRFDRFTTESGRDGNETVQDNWTGGINISPNTKTRIQLNYISKQTSNDFVPDFDDDVLYVNFQLFFYADLSR
jgi:hypothetical protein